MIQDNTTKWKVRKFTDFASNQAMPLGYVHWSISPIVPAGELPLLGGTYDRSLYADLWSWANENGLVISESEWQANVLADGKCDKFSDGNGSTTFRVPKLPTTIASDVPSENLLVKGTGINLGLTNGTNNYGLRASGGSGEYLSAAANIYGTQVGSTPSTTGVLSQSLGVTTDGSKSGMVAEAPKTTKITGQWLIVAFGVAHNIGEVDVANVMQAVESVQTGLGTLEQGVGTAIDYIVDTYRNGTEWYEVYKSGKVRQGGKLTPNKTDYTLLKPYANTNYTVLSNRSTDSSDAYALKVGIKNTTTIQASSYQGNQYINGWWIAEGQGA